MRTFSITQGDLLPAIEEQLIDGTGEPIALTDGAEVSFVAARRRGEAPTIDAAAEVVDDGSIGHVRYLWQEGDTDEAGEFIYVWVVTWSDTAGKPQTFPSPGANKLVIERRLSRAVVEPSA